MEKRRLVLAKGVMKGLVKGEMRSLEERKVLANLHSG